MRVCIKVFTFLINLTMVDVLRLVINLYLFCGFSLCLFACRESASLINCLRGEHESRGAKRPTSHMRFCPEWETVFVSSWVAPLQEIMFWLATYMQRRKMKCYKRTFCLCQRELKVVWILCPDSSYLMPAEVWVFALSVTDSDSHWYIWHVSVEPIGRHWFGPCQQKKVFPLNIAWHQLT